MAYGIFRKVTTLEFFQHHFAKSGHKDYLLMTRQLISTARQPPLHYLTRSVRRASGFVLTGYAEVIPVLPTAPFTSGWLAASAESPASKPTERLTWRDSISQSRGAALL